MVGVNAFKEENEKIEIPILEISPQVEIQQKTQLSELRASRNNQLVNQCMAELKQAAETDTNLMPILVRSAKAYATVGEMVEALKDVFGEYVEPAEF